LNPDYNVERNGVLIDGNYINAEGREIDFFQETIDLLYKVKRLPEVVFVLKIKNDEFEKMVNRIVDEKEIFAD